MFQIPTLYTNYQELLLDLDILGKILRESNINKDDLKALLFEEYKLSHPLPTLEDKRYELSSIVSSDYHIMYSNDIELADNEVLVDLGDTSDSKQVPILSEVIIPQELKQCTNVTDDVRQKIVDEFVSKEEAEQMEKVFNTVEDKSIKFDENSIMGYSESEDIYDEQSIEGEEDVYTEQDEDSYNYSDNEEVEEDDYSYDYSDDAEVEEADYSYDYSDGEEEVEDDYNEEVEDEVSYDYSGDEELEYDYNEDTDETEEVEDDYDEDNYDNNDVDDYSGDSNEEVEDDYSYNEDDNYDEDDYNYDNDVEDDYDEVEDEQDIIEDYDIEENSVDFESENSEDDINIEGGSYDVEEVESVSQVPTPVEIHVKSVDKTSHNNVEQVETIVNKEEPKDLRDFIRKHPRCEISFALQYFSRKEIEKYLMMGKIIKKGTKLHI